MPTTGTLIIKLAFEILSSSSLPLLLLLLTREVGARSAKALHYLSLDSLVLRETHARLRKAWSWGVLLDWRVALSELRLDLDAIVGGALR